VLYNSDIDIIILNKAFKNKAYELSLTKELKIYKKNYLIEILSILFSVHVVYEKRANNTYLVTAICEALRIVFFSL
jgi:predicted nucleotidyltransferase